jgi:hypothetical protein
MTLEKVGVKENIVSVLKKADKKGGQKTNGK